MPQPTVKEVKTLRTGINYPDPANPGEEVRVEAGTEVDLSTLPAKVLAALNDMGVWVVEQADEDVLAPASDDPDAINPEDG